MKIKVFNEQRTSFRTISDVMAVRTATSGGKCKVIVAAGNAETFRTYVFDPKQNPIEWREEDGENN